MSERMALIGAGAMTIAEATRLAPDAADCGPGQEIGLVLSVCCRILVHARTCK